ncbi:RNA-directed DNA polymerase [Chloroflexota bacterium]
MTLLELLRDGYFPKELPPPFSTVSFATQVTTHLTSMPATIMSGNFPSGRPTAITASHHVTRVGKLQRLLGIPNPLTHLRLCNEIANNWTALHAFTHASPLSVSKPNSATGQTRALIPQNTWSALPEIRAAAQLGNRYLVKADIESFYHSIYTHSLSWALHTKAFAKINRDPNHLGNRLDTLVRNGQDGQTIGIPIGPDTSLLLAEIILAAVDATLITSLGNLDGFRFVDDYEICCPTLSHAEKVLHSLESALSSFELSLNPYKTKIHSIPIELHANWATELRHFEIRAAPRAQRNNLIEYFSRAIELSVLNPDKSVLRFCIARFRNISIDSTNVPLLQTLLLHCVSCEQGTIPFVLEILVRLHLNGCNVPTVHLQKVFNSHIQYHAPLGHTSEVAWSIWGAITFNVMLDSTTANLISTVDDSIVALLSLDADSRNLFSSPLDKTLWIQDMTQQELYEGHWLLSYEANVKGWLTSTSGIDHVSIDPNFSFLKTNGVQFYDLSQAGPVVPKATEPFPGPTGDVSPI